MTPDDAWLNDPANPCRGKTRLFYGHANEFKLERQKREAAAVAICHICPNLDRCATHAITNREEHGIWGGLTEADRHTPGVRQPPHIVGCVGGCGRTRIVSPKAHVWRCDLCKATRDRLANQRRRQRIRENAA